MRKLVRCIFANSWGTRFGSPSGPLKAPLEDLRGVCFPLLHTPSTQVQGMESVTTLHEFFLRNTLLVSSTQTFILLRWVWAVPWFVTLSSHILRRELRTSLCNKGVLAPYYFVIGLKWPLQKSRQEESHYNVLLPIFSNCLFLRFSIFLWRVAALLQCV